MSNSSWNNTVTEIAAGSFGGVVQVLVGQPFDTIKVRLQSQPVPPIYNGTLDCVTKTIRQEGPLALYKGTLSPLAGIAFCVSIQFATLEHFKRLFKEQNIKTGNSTLSLTQMYIAGGIAGLANSFASGPVEHIRTRMQVQSSNAKEYSSTLNCFKKVYANYGLKGIYKGQIITMLREWQGFGGYFLVYEYFVQRAKNATGKKVSELHTYEIMTYGALAGYGMWIPVFPLDSIKSRIQTDSFSFKDRKYNGWIDCLMKTIKVEGFKGLYKGFVPCMLRAAPVNAATFVAYEFAMKQLQKDR